MDPNANLEDQRAMADEIMTIIDEAEGDGIEDMTREQLIEVSNRANDLANLVTALDEWMSKGGAKPRRWIAPDPVLDALADPTIR